MFKLNKEMNRVVNKDELFIGVDFAHDGDYSCSIISCGNCKGVINATYDKDSKEQVNTIVYKSCPYCGIEFKQFIINN